MPVAPPPSVRQPLCKVLTFDQWAELRADGETGGAPIDLEDGYVHLSTPGQVGETIVRHFAGHDDLWLLTLDGEELGAAIRWEPSRGGEDFPHLYGPLRLADVRAVRRLSSAPIVAPPPAERWTDLDHLRRDGDERTMLTGLLDWYRDGVLAKVAGLDTAAASRRFVTSETTIIGLVHHLGLVEDWWFPHRFLGEAWPEPWGSVDWDATPDFEFEQARDLSMDQVVARFVEAVTRARAVIAASSLDDLAASPTESGGPFTMRWLLLHMLEEYARHLGHLDILRELTDGQTGA